MAKETTSVKKTVAKILGILFLIVGGCLLYFGFYDFFSALSQNSDPTLFVCSITGIPTFTIGIFFVVYGFSKSVSLYIKNQDLTASNDSSGKILVKIKSSSDDVAVIDDRHCPSCGTLNDADSKFCKSCGNKL